MHDTILNPDAAKLDLSKVAALQQKRTLAFVNHFVTTTVQFLNNFVKNCEHKLMHFERKLEKVEASLVLLEARLSSIPEVNTLKEQEDIETKEVAVAKETEISTEENVEPPISTNKQETTEISQEYERFVKMVHVGVPVEAVKLKASLEGLDPNILQKILSK